MNDLTGKHVLVVGAGLSGVSTAKALLRLGASVRVTEAGSSAVVTEQARMLESLGAAVEIGGHDFDALHGDLAIVSPGIPPHAPVFKMLVERAIPIWSEIELAYRLAKCDVLAVTGTNGKTTTTSLLAAILAGAGIDSAAAGNIGLPLIDAVHEVKDGGAIAAEVSSFQLATIDTFRPAVAVLLNVAEDHTDWHGSFDAYALDKGRITLNQTGDDVLLVNADDPWCMKIASTSKARVVPFSRAELPRGGIGPQDGWLHLLGGRLIAASDLPLPGSAGLEDTLAAAGAAEAYGVALDEIAAAVSAFRPLDHRLQIVGEWDGVTFIDDSKATNPHATLAAVRGMTDVVLIAGGRSKGIDLAPLRQSSPPVTAVVALGEAADEVVRVFEGVVPVDRASSMQEAVELAVRRSPPGGSVLLSPGCASLDMYDSYAARGKDFARAARVVMQASSSEGNRQVGNS